MFWQFLNPRTAKSVRSLTAIVLIVGLLFSSSPMPVLADDPPAAPSAPTAPSAPEPIAPPPAPTAPEPVVAPTLISEPTAPAAPSAPEPISSPTPISEPTAPTPSPSAGDDSGGTSAPTAPASPTQTIEAGGITVTNGSGGSSVSSGAASANLSVNNNLNTNTATAAAGELDVRISNRNAADLANANAAEAETGKNHLGSSGGIGTGRAFASVSNINVVNTNIFDSQGLFLFLDNLKDNGPSADLDLRQFDFFKPLSKQLAPNPEPLERLVLTNSNTATITNTLISRAGTGDNLIESRGDGFIETGDAFAAANLINVANTNIVGSNYLLLVFNNFGDWGSDVVFPNASVFSQLFPGFDFTGGSRTAVWNKDQAKVANNLAVSASSGDNAVSARDSSIESGETLSASNVVNVVNTDIFNQDSLFVLFKVHGNWTGDVFGAPEGLAWTEENGTIKLVLTPAKAANQAAAPAAPIADELIIRNKNKAVIENNIEVIALTGENRVDSVDEAVIKSGDAFAAANLINVVNTNVVGKNWLMAIVNIFGDWSGNISFGRPDLWVGARAEFSDQPIRPGSQGQYHFTVANRGDAPATGVKLFADVDLALANLSELSGGSRVPTGMVWDIGRLAPGEIREISAAALISQHLPFGQNPITLSSRVQARESDNNSSDNRDQLIFVAERAGGGSIPLPQPNNAQPQDNRPSNPTVPTPTSKSEQKAEVSKAKEKSKSAIPAPNLKISKIYHWQASTTTVEYVIVITNFGGGPLYGAKMYDVLTNEHGEIVNEELWDLDTIYPDEEITLTYTVIFKQSGVYRNAASVIGYAGETPGSRYEVESEIASTLIEIEVKEDDEDDELLKAAAAVDKTSEQIKDVLGAVSEPLKPKPALAAVFLDDADLARQSLGALFLSGLAMSNETALWLIALLLIFLFSRVHQARQARIRSRRLR